jgi:hypothetical protein
LAGGFKVEGKGGYRDGFACERKRVAERDAVFEW